MCADRKVCAAEKVQSRRLRIDREGVSERLVIIFRQAICRNARARPPSSSQFAIINISIGRSTSTQFLDASGVQCRSKRGRGGGEMGAAAT